MAAKEHALPPMVADALVRFARIVHALAVAAQHARLKVLAQPPRIGQRQIGERLLALHVVPRCAHIVVPADDALDGVAHQIDVDRRRQIESM